MSFDQVRLPADAILPESGGVKSPLMCLNQARYGIVWGTLGAAMACFDEALQYARQRIMFDKPIAATQLQQERLADMLTSLHASRALVHRCALRRANGSETHADVAMAKLHATEAAAAAAEQAVMLHGARGYSSEFPVERLWRDVQALRIYEGTSMIQKTILARMLSEPAK